MTVASHASRGVATLPRVGVVRVAWRAPARALATQGLPHDASRLIARLAASDADVEVAWALDRGAARVELSCAAQIERASEHHDDACVLLMGEGAVTMDALGLTHAEARCDDAGLGPIHLSATLRGERVLWASTHVLAALGVRGGCYELA
jgi:hypothetical protein